MRMSGILLLALTILLGAGSAWGSELVSDLSESDIEVSYRYAGESLLVFGSLPEAGGHVLVEVRGPPSERTVQRKGKVMGFLWMNVASATFADMPGFYALLADAPLDRFLSAAAKERLGVGSQALLHSAKASVADAHAERKAYFDGLLRSMRADGLYREDPGGITVKRGRLFRGRLQLPAQAPVGDYRITVRQIKDGEVVHRDDQDLRVAKSGVEKWLYDLAHEHAAWYGVMAILVALTTGWLVGMITRGEGEH